MGQDAYNQNDMYWHQEQEHQGNYFRFRNTGIPRLTRFSIARFPIARIFEVVQENLHSTVLYLKIYSVMQIFLTFFQVIL